MRVFVVCLMMCLLVGCSDPASQAEDIGYVQLKADAQQMLDDCRAEYGSVISVPESHWPSSIKTFNPVEVRMHMFGVLVVTEETERSEQGIYIVTSGDSTEMTQPSTSGGLSYTMIQPGLHIAKLKSQLAASGS